LYYYYRLPGFKARVFKDKILRFLQPAPSVTLILALSYAIYTALTLTLADMAYRENTIDSLRAAARLNPRSGAIPLALGIQIDLAGGDPEPAFRAAAELSPYLAEPRMRLGLLAEMRGDLQSAERHLLHAADLELLRQPRAVLMAFYARRGDAGNFWRWARLTLERGYGDLTPFFNLCWQMAADPAEVYDKAIPRNRLMLRSYVAYLLSRGAIAPLQRPARDLLAVAMPQDADLLLPYCDRLIDSSPAEAVAVWNAACLRRVIQSDPIDPERSPSLVNGAFRNAPVQHGFDWKIQENGAIATALLPDGGIEFSFTGRQGQTVQLLSQITPVPAGRRRRLTIEYRTDRITNPSGLHFEAQDRSGTVVAGAPLPASDTLRTQSCDFSGGPSGLTTVRLRYERPLGSVRTEGSLSIRFVRLAAVE
jgi:hypothetical protein